jgi:hypothetical protein
MESSDIAALDNQELLEFLQQKNAPILNANTSELGTLFGLSFHGYSLLEREFSEASFGEQLFTDQKHFLSMTYPRYRHLAKTPEGSGKAPDLLHMYLRTLGMRLSNVFLPTAKRLIGDEANIRKVGAYDPKLREHVVIKDRPPNADARKTLEDVKEFDVILSDSSGEKYTITLQNEKTKVHYHDQSFNILETALALREQSIITNGRSDIGDTFTWIRDIISLQSVETIVQVQKILSNAITCQLSQKTLKDFNLDVPTRDRLSYARAVFERGHESRRDHALTQIWQASNEKNMKHSPTSLSLQSVAENPDGFEIQNTQDAAAVLFMMPRAFRILQYAFGENFRETIPLEGIRKDEFEQLATKVFSSQNKNAAAAIGEQINIVQYAIQKNDDIMELLKDHPYIDKTLGIHQANRLLRTFLNTVNNT